MMQVVGQAVVAHVYHQIQVISTDRSLDRTFALAGTETGRVGLNKVGVPLISCERNVGLVLQIIAVTPVYQVVVDLFAKLLTAL